MPEGGTEGHSIFKQSTRVSKKKSLRLPCIFYCSFLKFNLPPPNLLFKAHWTYVEFAFSFSVPFQLISSLYGLGLFLRSP